MNALDLTNKDSLKIQNTLRFINATQELIDKEGVEHVSIRKIAQQAGFHNSTIYLYFDDMDELIMLASIKYFQEYSELLERQSKKQLSPVEDFFSIWEVFFDTILKLPNLFYNFFYGKCSDNIEPFMKQYYELFPEERKHFSTAIESMYYGKNITERSMRILRPLLDEPGNRLTEETIELQNELIVSYCKYKLDMKRQDESIDSEEIKADFLNVLTLITGVQPK